jgi:glutamyl-tRNA synthetase
VDDYLMGITHVIRGQEHLNNTPGQQCLWQALFGTESLPEYAHMSVTISEGGGKLSKRERPKTLKKAIKAMPDIDLDQLAQVGDISQVDLDRFLAGKTTPDMPSIDAMAGHLGVALPEINVVDFMRSGYLPETMVNFLALLGWNPGDDREVLSLDDLIQAFDIERLTKSNSLFDRPKLVAFNTEHMRMVPAERLICYLRHYLEQIDSPVARANDATLEKLIHLCEGARTLADIHTKCGFAFVDNDKIIYDTKAVNKVLLKGNGLEMLALVYDRLAAMERFTEQDLEALLRGLAEEQQVGLGKVAQPLRVAICGTTVSPAIFDSVNMLGKENTLERIHNTLTRFGSSS